MELRMASIKNMNKLVDKVATTLLELSTLSLRTSETNPKPIATKDGIDVEITPYDFWALHLVLHNVNTSE